MEALRLVETMMAGVVTAQVGDRVASDCCILTSTVVRLAAPMVVSALVRVMMDVELFMRN